MILIPTKAKLVSLRVAVSFVLMYIFIMLKLCLTGIPLIMIQNIKIKKRYKIKKKEIKYIKTKLNPINLVIFHL